MSKKTQSITPILSTALHIIIAHSTVAPKKVVAAHLDLPSLQQLDE
jgi:hypothetical protein